MSLGTINGIAFSGTQRAAAKSDEDLTPSNIPTCYWLGGRLSCPVFLASCGADDGHGETLSVVGRGDRDPVGLDVIVFKGRGQGGDAMDADWEV